MTIMEKKDAKPCSNPGCDQPGTNQCSSCKSTTYCGPICQTADWPHHKEECDGHLRKVGKANLDKVMGFHREQKWMQALRYCEIAATKLKQLKDRRLETVEAIDNALGIKFDALQFFGRHREAMECIKECYTVWAMNHLRNPGSMNAALSLIQSCIHNKEYEDALLYARHAYFMIAEMTDNFIPSDEQPWFLAEVSRWLALAIYRCARAGGIPPEGKQKAGEEAIMHASKALVLFTQLRGTESTGGANNMTVLAEALDYFNDVDDDEVLHLLDQAIAIYRRVEGSSSYNVGVHENKIGCAYESRAKRAIVANDLNRSMVNLELALPHYRESLRIFRAINHVDNADMALHNISVAEENIRSITIAIAAAATAAEEEAAIKG